MTVVIGRWRAAGGLVVALVLTAGCGQERGTSSNASKSDARGRIAAVTLDVWEP